jgi:hypothetical protein
MCPGYPVISKADYSKFKQRVKKGGGQNGYLGFFAKVSICPKFFPPFKRWGFIWVKN